MKITNLLATLLVASAVASARAACPSGTSLDTSIENFPAAHRIATDDAAYGASDVTVASDFSVHYDTYFKVVRTYCGVHTPDSCVPHTYVLTLCGATAPTTYTNGTAFPEDAKHFTIPVTGIGLPGSTPVTFVEMLDLRDAIELVNPQYVHSPCVQKLEETEQIDTVDTDWAARAAAHEDVQVVFTDSWNTAQIDKDVVFDASSDPGALARAEWIKFMSVFFNEEEKANLYFAREKAAFEATAASTASLSAALYADAANRKTCAWVQKYQSYNADWSLGAIEYHVSYSVYKQELCVGAGMTPATDAVDLALDAPAYKMVFTSLADFHAKLVTYDVIIDETYQSAPLDATKDVVLTSLGIDAADTAGALKAGALLLRVDAHVTDAVTNLTDANSNALDWYESAIARPALVLTDLAHRAWPDDIAAPAAGCSRFFRDVLAGEMPTANGKDQCDTWLAAETEQMCLNNPVLPWDAYLEENAASKTLGHALALLVGGVAALLVA